MAALRVLLAASALALPLWLAAMAPARACTCAAISPGEQAFPAYFERQVAAADLIVIATPLEMRLLGPVPEPKPLSPPDVVRSDIDGPPAEISVQVEEYIKGTGPATLAVYQRSTSVTVSPGPVVDVRPHSSGMCGTFDQMAVVSLLFLYREGDRLHDGGVCGGSVQITEYNASYVAGRIEQIRHITRDQLAQPSALPPLGTGPPPRDGPSNAALVIAAVAGVALASGALLLGRPRES
jgi:hypothetical protein